jgi:hypothetical protein
VIAGCVISSISDELREEISIKGVLFSRALLHPKIRSSTGDLGAGGRGIGRGGAVVGHDIF